MHRIQPVDRPAFLVHSGLLSCALVAALSCDATVVGSADQGAAHKDVGQQKLDGPGGDASGDGAPACTGGLDNDNDGYGIGCPAGPDCDDTDPLTHPGAPEVCDGKDNNCNNLVDEGAAKNACGTCDPGCSGFGNGSAFPVNKGSDPNLKDINGVGLDGNGDLELQKTSKNFNYMWIANTFDVLGYQTGCTYANDAKYISANAARCRGSISKVDTKNMKEVARYYSTTCKSKTGATSCVDLHGKPITAAFPHAPSRTAVDYNFDVWVANRGFNGQPSATKIANDISDCKDRNNNKVIDTSADRDGDGKITVDCDGDGAPDSLSTKCTGSLAGKTPEFLGDDDECILFTVNYGDAGSSSNTLGDVGRSVCLDAGTHGGASNAWVGTYYHTTSGDNRYYRIDGAKGTLSGPFPLKSGHYVYGCVVDSQGILWSADINGTITYLNTVNPTTQVGPVLKPSGPSTVKFYGVTVDSKDNVWLGGYDAYMVFRYRPDRTSWSTLGSGKWTWVKQPSTCLHSRGIAADNRGKIWVAINNGYIFRVDQNIGDGAQDLSGSTAYWPVKGSTIIGVGVDFTGNVWAVSFNDHVASRLDVDSKGDPVLPATAQTKTVAVGKNPYTYSDFTGYGLQNFTRPQGRYLYQVQPCKNGQKARWSQAAWTATTPPGTSVSLRVRSGDSPASMGTWFGPYQTSPAPLGKSAANPLSPNPAVYLHVEFTLTTSKTLLSPTLHDFNLAYDCTGAPE